jgi:hypothetical protein
MTFEVLIIVTAKITVFWYVILCTLVDMFKCTKLHGVTSQRAIIFRTMIRGSELNKLKFSEGTSFKKYIIHM